MTEPLETTTESRADKLQQFDVWDRAVAKGHVMVLPEGFPGGSRDADFNDLTKYARRLIADIDTLLAQRAELIERLREAKKALEQEVR